MIKAVLTAMFIGTQFVASAFSLRVTGVVTDLMTSASLENVLVSVFRDGAIVNAQETGLLGRYAMKLENDADYVIRFSGPALVTKYFTIDTHGLVWEGADKVKVLEVQMTMIERITCLDLSFFDMPMGRAFFEPATGLVSWDTDYDRKIRPQLEALMGQYQRMMTAQASAVRMSSTSPADRR